jgi:hypothetical protein
MTTIRSVGALTVAVLIGSIGASVNSENPGKTTMESSAVGDAPKVEKLPGSLTEPPKAWSKGSFSSTPECTTSPTGGDGLRDSCASGWNTVTATAGQVIVEKSVHCTISSANGSHNNCAISFATPV